MDMPNVTKRVRAGREEIAVEFGGYTVIVRETTPKWPKNREQDLVEVFVHKHTVHGDEVAPRGYVAGANFLETRVDRGLIGPPSIPQLVARGLRKLGAS